MRNEPRLDAQARQDSTAQSASEAPQTTSPAPRPNSFRVVTGSRLHFGLICPGSEGSETRRRFGGVGVMIEAPGLALRAEDAPDWSAEGPLAPRAMDIASRVVAELSVESFLPPRRLIIEDAAPEHAGLGTGTQLALAVASALLRSWGQTPTSGELARLTGRGRRSALGVHGFEQGGFLVDGGKGPNTTLAPLIARHDFPSAWRILIVVPAGEQGLAGSREQAAFDQLCARRQSESLQMCRVLLLGMLPTLAERDLPAFSEALFEFNVLAGELFAPVQGGCYAGAGVTEMVTWLRGQGVSGVGQSSWGPGVFGIIADEEQGAWILARVRERFPLAQAWLTSARNRGSSSE